MTFAGSDALANTVTQNTSWTIDRAGTTAKYRITAYGDSIYAATRLDLERREARRTVERRRVHVAALELGHRSHAPHKSGAVASDIYNNKIVAERSYMQAANTRIVTFEMCGNDGCKRARTSRARAAPATGAARHRADELHELHATGDAVHQRQREPEREAQGRIEPVLPGLCIR
jgi:hypothetical protein